MKTMDKIEAVLFGTSAATVAVTAVLLGGFNF